MLRQSYDARALGRADFERSAKPKRPLGRNDLTQARDARRSFERSFVAAAARRTSTRPRARCRGSAVVVMTQRWVKVDLVNGSGKLALIRLVC